VEEYSHALPTLARNEDLTSVGFPQMNCKLFSKHNVGMLPKIGIGSLESGGPEISSFIMGECLQAWLL